LRFSRGVVAILITGVKTMGRVELELTGCVEQESRAKRPDQIVTPRAPGFLHHRYGEASKKQMRERGE
jgi:hypothetical protein